RLDLHRDRTVRRRHRDVRAQGSVGEAHRHVDDEIGAAALEGLRRRHSRDHVEIARLRPAVAGLALAAQANPRAVVDAGRDLDRVPLRAPLARGAAAARTRILDHRAVSAAARARLREREEPLALRLDAAPVTLGTERRRGSRLRARAGALAAGGLELDRNLGLDPAQRVVEREVDLYLQVAPAPTPLLLLRPPAAAEEPAEDVAEVAEISEVEPLVGEAAGPGPPVLGAEAIVLLPLLGVGEHVVGGLHLLEALLRSWVARVCVRVVLAGELAVGLLDLVLTRALGHAEGLVEILNRRHRSPAEPPPRRVPGGGPGRRGGSPSAPPRAPSPPRPRRAGRAAPRGRAGRSGRSSRSR